MLEFIYIKMCVSCSVVSNSATPWTIAGQIPLSVEFSRQEYWSGLPFPSPEDLSDPGIEPGSPELQADSLPSEPILSIILRYSGQELSQVLSS